MEIHWLDILIYFIGLVIIYLCLPEEYKFEMGIIVGFIIMLIYSVIYFIIFGLCGVNVIDIWNSLEMNITVVK